MTQYQSCRYDTLHFCPSISPTDSTKPSTSPTNTIQSTTAPVQVLLIYTFNYCPSASSTDTTQYTTVPYSYWYYTFHYYPTTSLIYMTQSTIAPFPVLLIQHSPLLSTVLLLLIWSSLPLPTVGDWYVRQPMSVPERVLLIWYDPVPDLLDTMVHYCPRPVLRIPYNAILLRTSPIFVRVPVLLIWYAAYFCPSTSPADMIQSLTAPAPDQLIR